MSDTIVVLKDGVIQQIGTPTDVYNEPKNPFVADFIGGKQHPPRYHVQDYKVRMNGVLYECGGQRLWQEYRGGRRRPPGGY